MVHRSVVGSMERAVAHLIERHGGAFPDWLAPEQLVVLPVAGAQAPPRPGSPGRPPSSGCAPTSPDRNRHLEPPDQVVEAGPYQAVIGEREAAADQVAVRLRDGRRLPPLPADAALAGIAAHVAAHRTGLWDAAACRPGERPCGAPQWGTASAALILALTVQIATTAPTAKISARPAARTRSRR